MRGHPSKFLSVRWVPLALTLTRIALLPLVALFVSVGNVAVACGVFACAAVTDVLDGYCARKWNATTRLGALLDPLADKVLIAVAYVSLYMALPFIYTPPLWFLWLTLAKEVAFVCTGVVLFWLYYPRAPVIAPTWWGKAAMVGHSVLAVIVLVTYICALPVPSLMMVLAWGTTCVMLGASIDYARKVYYAT